MRMRDSRGKTLDGILYVARPAVSHCPTTVPETRIFDFPAAPRLHSLRGIIIVAETAECQHCSLFKAAIRVPGST